jgi:hypothetical protein
MTDSVAELLSVPSLGTGRRRFATTHSCSTTGRPSSKPRCHDQGAPAGAVASPVEDPTLNWWNLQAGRDAPHSSAASRIGRSALCPSRAETRILDSGAAPVRKRGARDAVRSPTDGRDLIFITTTC